MKKVLIPILLFMVLVLVPYSNAYAKVDVVGKHSQELYFMDAKIKQILENNTSTNYYLVKGDGTVFYYIRSNDTISYPLPFTSVSNSTSDTYMGDTITSYKTSFFNGSVNTSLVSCTKYTLNTSTNTWTTSSSNSNGWYSPYKILYYNGSTLRGTIDNVIATNMYFYDGNGTPVVTPKPYTTPDYKPTPLAFEIIKPSLNYKDTVDGVETLISYTMPPGTEVTNISINISSTTIPNENWKIVRHDYDKATGKGLLSVFATPIPIGTHTISVNINDTIKTATYQKLGGIVDENNDGIDDRTNQPIGDGHVPDIPDGTFIENTVSSLKLFTQEFKGFETFIKSFLGIFPTWITLPISTLFGVLVIMTILKIIRG